MEENGTTESELAACAKGYTDQAHDLLAEVDGVAVDNLSRYRFVSPIDTFTLTQPNIFGLSDPQPNPSPFVADGSYAMVLPLSEGQNDIRFAGHLGTSPGEFRTDVLYQLTVK